jgi:hypothetical protein
MFEFTPLLALALPVIFIGFLLYLRNKFFDPIAGAIMDTISSWFKFKNYKQKEKFEMVLFFIIGISFSFGLVGLLYLIPRLTQS